MKNYFTIGLGIIIVGLFFSVVVKSATFYYLHDSNVNKTATSSTSYIIGGTSTTTKTVLSDGYEQISYMISLASSTTPPQLCWRNQFSNDNNFWYGEDAELTTNATTTTHVRTAKEHCWVYASSTDPTTSNQAQLVGGGNNGKEIYVFKKVVVPNLDTPYTRTVFSITPGANARLGVEINKKNELVLQK